MTQPAQNPGNSKQDYGTPPEFLAALKRKLGINDFAIDLAASEENRVTTHYYDEALDALTQPWNLGGWAFCNPPYAKIEPWVNKAWTESRLGAHVAMLLPAGVGSNWWKHWVHGRCHVLLLNGRITFVGAAHPYPKDLVVLLYTPMALAGYSVWDWN